jgi:uncharacterized membrane protein HdeD (DUF308 family)
MSDPITTSLMAKAISGLSGLIGGVLFMAFYRPKNVWDAAIRSGLSTTAAIVFSPILINYLDLQHNMNNVIALSVCLGFCAWSVLSIIARFLIKIQDEKVNIKLPGFLEKK